MTRRPRKPIDSSADFNEVMKAAGAITVDDFVAYREHHNFIFRANPCLWPAASVDAELPQIQLPSGKRMSASRWLDTQSSGSTADLGAGRAGTDRGAPYQ